MAKLIGTNVNQNDEGTTTTVALNSSTSTKIIDALAVTEQDHIKIYVDNPSQHNIFVKFQSAATDDNAVGLKIYRKDSKIITELPNGFRDEISAIAQTGSPTITIIKT